MSQKPRTGAQARPASVAKVDAKQVVPATVTAKVESVAKATPVVKADPVVTPKPATAPVMPKPVAIAAPVAPKPVAIAAPVVPEAAVMAAPVVPPPVITAPVAAPVSSMEQVSKPTPASPPKIATLTVVPTAPTSPPAVVTAAAPSLTPKPPLTQGIKTMMKSTEEFVAFGQANLEAFMKSGQIWSAGVQDLTKKMATCAKASFEESVSTFKAISTAKSVKEAMDLQSTFAKAALEKAMAESNKLTDASIKLTEETLAPITARMTVAVETFGKAH
jgi:phasin family protein